MQRAIILASAFVAFAVFAAVAVSFAVDDGSGVAREASERKLILIGGLNSASDCEHPDLARGTSQRWGQLTQRIADSSAINPRDDVLFFSYAGDYDCPDAPSVSRARYTSDDTCATIDADFTGSGHARAFDAWFRDVAARHPDATFDIIGHSQGGVVAAYWAAAEASDEEIARVRSIVTLSSPLQGRPGAAESARIGTTLGIGCVEEQGALFDLDPASDVVAAINHPASPGSCDADAEEADVAGRVPVLNLNNVADLLVPATIACLPGATVIEIFDPCGRGGHDCVFTNERTRDALLTWLTSDPPSAP